jgi:hypothetical protein
MRVGMPKIPENSLNLAFYLYETLEDAKDGVKIGGTGFYVGVPSEKHPSHKYIYGVTNYHVAVKPLEGLAASVIRMNMDNGKTDILDFDSSEWEYIPGGGDIAISPILEKKEEHSVTGMLVEGFATEKVISDRKINVGDDVFMVGRFIDHDGGDTNLPSARFGHISVMPTFIPEEQNNRDGKSYCLDMHSRTGYSGSLVIVYRTIGGDLSNISQLQPGFKYLLGILWGQFPEDLKDKNGNLLKGFSGMNCAAPADRILALINSPKLKAERDRRDAEREEDYKKHGLPPIPLGL